MPVNLQIYTFKKWLISKGADPDDYEGIEDYFDSDLSYPMNFETASKECNPWKYRRDPKYEVRDIEESEAERRYQNLKDRPSGIMSYFTEDEYRTIKQQALENCMSMSTFIKSIVLDYIKKKLS